MSTQPLHPIIGLEVHAELKTQSKMFCGCKNDPFHADQPNIYTCPVCLGLPGALPVANQKAIEWVIKLGLALHCKINLFSKFDRKHYFYPDLPKGYQISQYDLPFCYEGYVETSEGRVRIRRIHLEEDTAKLLHQTVEGQRVSLIDFNRSSVPLVEIVTEADIKTGTQAKEYGKKLRQIMRFLDIADCDMEQGGMRLEANISVSPQPYDPTDADFAFPPYKVEVKNINSFRFMEQAVNYEIERQGVVVNSGAIPVQETRGWDSIKNQTFSQRVKEDAADYRYFPDPDLPPILFTADQIETWRTELPELPDQLVNRWQTEYQLDPKLGLSFVEDRSQAEWWKTLMTAAKTQHISVDSLAKAIINKKIAAKLGDAATVVLSQFISLTTADAIPEPELKAHIQTVLSANLDAVAKYQAGKQQVFGYLMGQVAKAVGKKLDPKVTAQLLTEAVKAFQL